MSVDLDPKEVLEHLHSLGYCNISPELLKEFIRDLKKLMKYDQKKGLMNRKRREEAVPCCHHMDHCDDMQMSLEELEEDCGARTYRRKSPHKFQTQEYSDAECVDESEICGQNRPDSRVIEGTRKENIPPSSRPPSSFIRPNYVCGKSKPKSDPVALYHYYQSIWSQNPQPGEDPRAQLRWNIRHQMMGKQKPIPCETAGKNEEVSMPPTCGCPCCHYRLVKGSLPRRCPLNTQNVQEPCTDQNQNVEETYSNFVPAATSSNDQLNEGFNDGIENSSNKNEDEKNYSCSDEPKKSQKPCCSKCGKRMLLKSIAPVKRSIENHLVERKNTVSVGGPINKIRVVTEINFN